MFHGPGRTCLVSPPAPFCPKPHVWLAPWLRQAKPGKGGRSCRTLIGNLSMEPCGYRIPPRRAWPAAESESCVARRSVDSECRSRGIEPRKPTKRGSLRRPECGGRADLPKSQAGMSLRGRRPGQEHTRVPQEPGRTGHFPARQLRVGPRGAATPQWLRAASSGTGAMSSEAAGAGWVRIGEGNGAGRDECPVVVASHSTGGGRGTLPKGTRPREGDARQQGTVGGKHRGGFELP